MFSKKSYVLTVVVFVTCLCGGSASSETLEVGISGYEYNSIQSAINDARDGIDEVLVHDGTYRENIDFKGKAITVRSENGANHTTINGGGYSQNGILQHYKSVVFFDNGESRTSVLEGFKITNGTSSVIGGRSYYGGGIYCGATSPTIRKCIITGNYAPEAGGGIYLYRSAALISDCVISENSTHGRGGGIYTDASYPKIEGCKIENNTATMEGGGIACNVSDYLRLDSSTIIGNTATYGGGINFNESFEPTIKNCVIAKNTAIHIKINPNNPGEANITEHFGGGIYSEKSSPKFVNCTFSENQAGKKGGAMYMIDNSDIKAINSIFWGNKAANADNAFFLYYFPNRAPSYIDVTFSNIQGPVDNSWTTSPTTNISLNPLFAEGSYGLSGASPCIDKGSDTAENNEDIDGIARPQGAGHDMGAYEFCPNKNVFYIDLDGDGFGNVNGSKTLCSTVQPVGFVANSEDCNDNDASINPNAVEICNKIDDNCNGEINEGLSALTYYQDSDGDGFGSLNESVVICNTGEVPAGYITDNTDCDDNNKDIHPDGVETCNYSDDNCNGGIDEGFFKTLYYKDLDGDGFGNPNSAIELCSGDSSPLYVLNNDDCNDADASVSPNTTWYKDRDGDGFSDGVNIAQCTRPIGYKLPSELIGISGDEDDEDSSIKPEDVWYKDFDGDGYSNGESIRQETQPTGYGAPDVLKAINGDCDDTDYNINPETIWYKDFNNNGISDGTTIVQCQRPYGYKLSTELSATSGDENDDVQTPGSTEWYKDADNDGYYSGEIITESVKPDSTYRLKIELKGMEIDCDDANKDINPETIWYKDIDDDKFSDGMTTKQCTRPTGYKLVYELVATSGDENDEDANIRPGDIWYKDVDGDGYSDGESKTQVNQPENYRAPVSLKAINGDCDDTDYNVNPETIWYKDIDGDRFSDGTTIEQCQQPIGYDMGVHLIFKNGDCDDEDPGSYPGAIEICGDDIDQDCSGSALHCVGYSQIKVESITQLPGRSINFLVRVTDPANTVSSVTIAYSLSENSGMVTEDLEKESDNLWKITIPIDATVGGEIEYLFSSINSINNESVTKLQRVPLSQIEQLMVPSMSGAGVAILLLLVCFYEQGRSKKRLS